MFALLWCPAAFLHFSLFLQSLRLFPLSLSSLLFHFFPHLFPSFLASQHLQIYSFLLSITEIRLIHFPLAALR